MNKTGMYLRGDEFHPFHLSVGQVIYKDGTIAIIRKPDGVVTLPRETTYLEETYFECLERGATEEVGVVVEPGIFLGSLNTSFRRSADVVISKTTLYFLSIYVSDANKALESDEVLDITTWEPFDIAIALLKKTGEHEETIIEAARSLITGFAR